MVQLYFIRSDKSDSVDNRNDILGYKLQPRMMKIVLRLLISLFLQARRFTLFFPSVSNDFSMISILINRVSI